MRAAVMRDWELRIDDVADPVPGAGQVLARVLACGICGSDLHTLRHGAEAVALRATVDGDAPPDPLAAVPFQASCDVVMGHEFCCEVIDLGPGCDSVRVGERVVSMPAAFDAAGLHAIGYSNAYNGGYAEQMVLNELLALPVPADLPTELAALTEPLAVGVHAVAKSGIGNDDSAIVIGCGPVGLACIAALKLRGIAPVVAADFSPTRRRLAERMGADAVVDPRRMAAIDAWRDVDGVRPLVIFEAVGVPGMIEQSIRMAPKHTRVVVVGVCMQPDTFHPLLAIGKEISLQFVLAYEPDEFAAALRALADGTVDLSPWITGTVDIAGVPQAFADLADPEAHAKILVVPS